MVALLPCPFCGSNNIDPEGWASTERKGPACDDCAGTADTVEIWNTRPGLQRLQDIEASAKAVLDTFRKSEAAGYRSRDRQYAIDVLGIFVDAPSPREAT